MTFAVGDRVRVTAFPQQPQTIGELATVVEVADDKRPWPIWIRFDNGKHPLSCMGLEEIEHV